AVAGVNPPHDPTQEFWEVDLPLLAIDKLLEAPTDESIFDEIIVDEAQDLLKENYLDFLDLSLKGGLATGRIRLFGDFEKQAIYGSANLSVQHVLNARCNGASQY